MIETILGMLVGFAMFFDVRLLVRSGGILFLSLECFFSLTVRNVRPLNQSSLS